MADKLRQLVSAWIAFVDGEQPTAAKFSALVSQTKRGFSALEYALGDLRSQSWPYSSDSGGSILSTYLTIPWGRKVNSDEGVQYSSERGRPLDIVSLARLIGPASNLNPQFLSDGSQSIVGESIPADVNQFELRYLPVGTVVFRLEGGALSSTFLLEVDDPSALSSPGTYYLNDKTVYTYSPTQADTIASYDTNPSFWGGGSNYEGATFNVIPDPAQVEFSSTKLVVSGPTGGYYNVELPIATHQQKNYDSTSSLLNKTLEPSSGEQLTLPRWMTLNYSAGDVLPTGCIYLKCVDTNEVYTDAIYTYDSEKTLRISNIDLGTNGCSLAYCLLTVGTDITTSIDDIRRKTYTHSHNGLFGEPHVSIRDVTDILLQGVANTSLGGPYYPSSIPGNWMPQYLHRDGYRLVDGTGTLGWEVHEQERDIVGDRNGPTHNNALRGSLVIGRKEDDSGNPILGTDGSAQTPPYTSASDNRHYFGGLGESFHLTFGGPPVFHLKGSSAFSTALSVAEQPSPLVLNTQACQIYRDHWGCLRIESQNSNDANTLYSGEDSLDVRSSLVVSTSSSSDGIPTPTFTLSSPFVPRLPNGIRLTSRDSIVLDTRNYGSGSASLYLLAAGNIVENGFAHISIFSGEENKRINLALNEYIGGNYTTRTGGSYHRRSVGNSVVETENGHYIVQLNKNNTTHASSKQFIFANVCPQEVVSPDDPSAYGKESWEDILCDRGADSLWDRPLFSFHFIARSFGTVLTPANGEQYPRWWGGVAIHDGKHIPHTRDYPAYTSPFSDIEPFSLLNEGKSACAPTSAQLWVRSHFGSWNNTHYMAVFDNSISPSELGFSLHPVDSRNFDGNEPWSEGSVRGILIGTPGLNAFEDAQLATIWIAFRAKDKCVGKIISYRDTNEYGLEGGEWLDSVINSQVYLGVLWSQSIDAVGNEFLDINEDVHHVVAGDVAYVSGGKDYAEYMPLGDPEEWLNSEEDRRLFNFKSGSAEGQLPDVPNGFQFGLPEGIVVRIREGKIWRKGEGTPMVVSHRPCVVGNQSVEIGGQPYECVSFIGQLPLVVRGPIHDGDLAIPDKDNNWCVAIPKDDVTFAQYKRVVGTLWSNQPDKKDNELSKAICAIGVK